MKSDIKRFQEIIATFPKLEPILKQLHDANISYSIGGSVALYIQGNDRRPQDVDIMFTDESFDKANKLFGLVSEHIERPYNSMNKSTPVNDHSVDFLNQYTSKIGHHTYYSPPVEKTTFVAFKNRKITLIPAEKVAIFKLISRRDHHNDLDDFKKLFHNPDFDMDLFWKMVDLLGARKPVMDLINSRS